MRIGNVLDCIRAASLWSREVKIDKNSFFWHGRCGKVGSVTLLSFSRWLKTRKKPEAGGWSEGINH
jgi:hypothetical protein